MEIISRTFWFVTRITWIVIGASMVLMIVRLIVDAADLNPFGWMHRNVRRLSDGFVVPVRAALRGFGVDPKFAPLVVILIVILLGYFILQLLSTIASTIAGILFSIQTGSFVSILGYILYGLISIY